VVYLLCSICCGVGGKKKTPSIAKQGRLYAAAGLATLHCDWGYRLPPRCSVIANTCATSVPLQPSSGVLAPRLLGGRLEAAPTLRQEPLRIHSLKGHAQSCSRTRSVSPPRSIPSVLCSNPPWVCARLWQQVHGNNNKHYSCHKCVIVPQETVKKLEKAHPHLNEIVHTVNCLTCLPISVSYVSTQCSNRPSHTHILSLPGTQNFYLELIPFELCNVWVGMNLHW
jgi:hypothetical protein